MLTVSLLFFASMPQTAAVTTPSAATTADVNAKTKRTCRSEQELGSRMAKRRCLTAEQWEAEAVATRAQIQNQQSYSRASVR